MPYSERLGIAIEGDSAAQFAWSAGGSSVFSIFPAWEVRLGSRSRGERFELWQPPSGA